MVVKNKIIEGPNNDIIQKAQTPISFNDYGIVQNCDCVGWEW